jgi:hypothetical protein
MKNIDELSTEKNSRIVYVRTVDKDELPAGVRKQIDGNGPVFAIHNADGEVLALTADRAMAFAVARMNKFAPVSVH